MIHLLPQNIKQKNSLAIKLNQSSLTFLARCLYVSESGYYYLKDNCAAQ